MTTTELPTTTNSVSLPASQLARMLANGLLAASKELTRPVLNSVQLTWTRDGETETLRVRATDRYWLISETVTIDANTQGMDRTDGSWSVLVSARDLPAIIKAAKDKSMAYLPAVVEFDGQRTVTFRCGPVTFSTVAVDDRVFPNVEHIIGAWTAGELGEIDFGADLLAQVTKVQPATTVYRRGRGPGQGTGHVMRFRFSQSGLKAARVEWQGDTELFAIVMPCQFA